MTGRPEPADPRGRDYRAEQITVFYDRSRCVHFAECVRGLPEVFDTRHRPWIQPDGAAADQIAEVVRRCPSGALHYKLTATHKLTATDEPTGTHDPTGAGELTGADEEPIRPTRVEATDWGPLVVSGELRIALPDGGELRETRAALCACRTTGNPPFCDAACRRTS
ncbi:MAG: (4Fe-4S)-binding protein [Micromonosporaceae bacterium]